MTVYETTMRKCPVCGGNMMEKSFIDKPYIFEYWECQEEDCGFAVDDSDEKEKLEIILEND